MNSEVHSTNSGCIRWGRGSTFNQDPGPLQLTLVGNPEGLFPSRWARSPLQGGGIYRRPEGCWESETRPGGRGMACWGL